MIVSQSFQVWMLFERLAMWFGSLLALLALIAVLVFLMVLVLGVSDAN